MGRTRTFLATALAAFGIAAAPAAAADYWREPDGGPSPINVSGDLGLPSANRSNIEGLDIVDNAGVPYVTWSEWNGTAFLVRVARLEGNQWVQIGSALNANPTRNATLPSLAVNEGIVWATWIEQNSVGDLTIRVARRTGGGWQHIGGEVDVFPRTNPNEFGQPAGLSQLTFLNGVAYLGVMEDNSTDYEFHLLRLNANEEWVKADTGVHPHFLIPRSFELEISSGRLYLGSTSYIGGTSVWRLATNGRDWEDIGPPNYDELSPTDIEDFGGNHLGATYADQAWMLGTDGSWSPLGQPLRGTLGEGFATPWLLAEDPHTTTGSLRVLRLEANVWKGIGSGAIDNHDLHSHAQLAEVGPTPYMAWAEFDGCNWEVRVARLQSATGDDPALPAPGACPPPKDPPGGPGPNPNPNPNPNPGPNPNPQPPTGACGVKLTGTQSADTLTGTGARNEIAGLGGNDRLWGLGHADCLFGGVGNDMLDGGTGNDELHGEAGHDRLKGGADSDELFGGIGNDRVTGSGDEDELDGGSGNDVLAAGDGYDTVNGGSGNDVIDARGAGFDRIDCGPGRDRVKNATRRSDRLVGCEKVKYAR
jgi:hypothetical protein